LARIINFLWLKGACILCIRIEFYFHFYGRDIKIFSDVINSILVVLLIAVLGLPEKMECLIHLPNCKNEMTVRLVFQIGFLQSEGSAEAEVAGTCSASNLSFCSTASGRVAA
jgi:hypothetical protein